MVSSGIASTYISFTSTASSSFVYMGVYSVNSTFTFFLRLIITIILVIRTINAKRPPTAQPIIKPIFDFSDVSVIKLFGIIGVGGLAKFKAAHMVLFYVL